MKNCVFIFSHQIIFVKEYFIQLKVENFSQTVDMAGERDKKYFLCIVLFRLVVFCEPGINNYLFQKNVKYENGHFLY